MLGSVLGCALSALLAAPALAFSNTSPYLLLSDSRALRVRESDLDVESADRLLSTATSDAAKRCEYDAYIFVKHPNVSERDMTPKSMPFLAHTIDTVEGKLIATAALDGNTASADSEAARVESHIEEQCKALPVHVDVNSDDLLAAYTDTKPRLITLDFSERATLPSPSEADEVLRKVVGHLPSRNFLLSYRTTPKTQAGGTPASPAEPSPSAFASSASNPDDIPYESLFRNYQFFSPALFMGLLASGLLLAILIVAFNSVNSIEITTAAFEPKRAAPQKK